MTTPRTGPAKIPAPAGTGLFACTRQGRIFLDGSENSAPSLVLADRHPALHTYPDSLNLPIWFPLEQFLEVVVVNEKFGIRLTDIISPAERVKKLR